MLKVVSKSSRTAHRKSDGMRFGRQNSKIAEQGNTDRECGKSKNPKRKGCGAYIPNTYVYK